MTEQHRLIWYNPIDFLYTNIDIGVGPLGVTLASYAAVISVAPSLSPHC